MRVTRRHLFTAAGGAALVASPRPAWAAAESVEHAPGIGLKRRERLLLDFNWRFHLGHASDPAKDFGFGAGDNTFAKAGANVAAPAEAKFDDSAWARIDLPHDWAVELPFVPSEDAPTDEDPRAMHGFKPLGRRYPETSIGWYRRVFDIAKGDLGRRIGLEFDGVFRDGLVLFNGHVVARNASGYAPFRADVTDFVNYGGPNVLVLRVDASLGEGWFYEGAGIYRHVWLVKTHAVHVPQWGTFARAAVGADRAMVSIDTEVANAGAAASCVVVSSLVTPDGARLGPFVSEAQRIESGSETVFRQQVIVERPARWSVDAPALYRLETEVRADGAAVDDFLTAFGIRNIRFDPAQGFFLNEAPVKLKGTCNHQDHAGVGSALPDRLQDFRIEKLKALGSNAYRAAHNPPAPELLDACDRLGMLVIDETRLMSSDAEGLSQLERMIRRDRNHPCVILWSIGNEEQGQQGTALGARVAGSMKRLASRLDPTRPITAAMDGDWGKGISPLLDVIGFNYRTDKIEAFHRRFPKQPVIGSETGSTVCTRGIYARDAARGFVPAYDTDFPWWASTAESWWKIVAERPHIAGGFVWTGFDYRGEPTPFNRWPNVASQFGILDSCGFAKDNWFYYRAQWSDAPLLHLFPHWNWRAGQPVEVWCHSNLDSVELLVNGASAGRKPVPRHGHVAWTVPFAPGVIEAHGYKDGARVLISRRETAGAAAAIVLKADRAVLRGDGEDVAVVSVEVVDVRGRLVPDADHAVSFAVTGPGRIIGVGNGDPTSHEPDKASARRAFNGLCMAIVQAGRDVGEIVVRAEATGLAGTAVKLKADAVRARAFVA